METLVDILNFCEVESRQASSLKSSIIMKIKFNLSKNLTDTHPNTISTSYLKSIIPTLMELDHYIHDIEVNDTEGTFSKQSSLSETLDDPYDITAVNTELHTLKELLNFSSVTFRPNNVGLYLKSHLYKEFSQTTTSQILNELIRLIQQPSFNVAIVSNSHRMRAMSFVNQLKNIFNDKKNKFTHHVSKRKPSFFRINDDF